MQTQPVENPSAAGAVSLKVLAERKVAGVSKQTTFNVDCFKVEFEEGFNGRPINRDHVESLKQTKRAGGEWPAIKVRVEDGRIICVDGHHRTIAQREMCEENEDVLPGLSAEQFRGNDADRVMLMITSQQGLPMTPLQLAVQYRKLIGFGWTVKLISERAGKSTQHVNDLIKLTEANCDVQAMVIRKEVAAHVAVNMVRKHGNNAGAVLAEHLTAAKKKGKAKVTKKVIDEANHKSVIEAIQVNSSGAGDDEHEHSVDHPGAQMSADEIKAGLINALQLCAGVLSGATLHKSALTGALKATNTALRNAGVKPEKRGG